MAGRNARTAAGADAAYRRSNAICERQFGRAGTHRGVHFKGAFYRPTLLEVSDHKMPIVQNEVFGPDLVMQAFDNEAEAATLANENMYGLAASVWSTDIDRPPGRAPDRRRHGVDQQLGCVLRRIRGRRVQAERDRAAEWASAIDDFVEYRTIIHEVPL